MFQKDPYRPKHPISTDDYDDGNIPEEDLPKDSEDENSLPKSTRPRKDGQEGT